MKVKHIRLSHTQIIALGFFLIIAAGTLLLMLPVSARSGRATPFTDALFTATSASCVTGLVVRDTYLHWSVFGQCVILVLIQLGGLGFMTIATFFFLLMRKKIGLRQRAVLSESINTTQVGGVVRLSKKILLGTFATEGAGAALLAIRFCPKCGFWKGIFFSVFHSVSAFCNAGFDLMGGYGPYSSFVPYADDVLVNLVLMALITIGGIGFLVWDDVTVHKWRLKRYRLHSKVVLFTSFFLTFGGAALFLIFEADSTGKGMSFGNQVLAALFDSVTARTAGFNTVDTASLSNSGKLLTVALMFVGGSPGSTAGGIKTTTIAVMLIYAFSYVRHNRSSGLFGRRFADDALLKASSVFFTNLTLALAATAFICNSQGISLTDALFETFSAIGTVGMTTGITRQLNTYSRYLIIFLMYCGRVGSLSFATALAEKKTPPAVKLPAEEVTIG